MTLRRFAAGLAIVVALAGCGTDDDGSTTGTGPLPTFPDGVVTRVVDGDTLIIELAGRNERVRLIGIDTPESVRPNHPVECFGPEASAFMESLVPPGTPVRLVRDVEARDVFDRLLAYVYRAEDDLFVNLEVVEQGYGEPLTIPPNVAYAEQFVRATREAREAGLGLWSACR